MPTITTHTQRCTDPNLYSLRASYTREYQTRKVYLPPLLDTSIKTFFETHHRFSDTSCQEKSIMIDKLIDCSANIIDSIWSNNHSTEIISTARFIREILKRSRATYSMLQLALFYIFRIKKLILKRMQQPAANNELVVCGRRMILAALMAASKYLNDKNYCNKTWAKIASLQISEINATEMTFLKLIDYRLYVSKQLYDKWVFLLHERIHRTIFIAITKQNPDMNCYYSPYASPCSLSCTSSPDTSAICSPVSKMQETPPLVFGRKRSLSSSCYGYDNSRTTKNMRHV
ncbi:cyclin-domain-containing protein [Parasitella parasitica]|nr:cyclin-domain-containing protein [Parasitella parasitica]